jgi:hypothetical protein
VNRRLVLALGVLATVGAAELWHGPLGAADELRERVETYAANALNYYGVPEIKARLDDRPLSRRLILSGPADDFQRRALVDLLGQLPGVHEVRWDPSSPVVNHYPRPPAR